MQTIQKKERLSALFRLPSNYLHSEGAKRAGNVPAACPVASGVAPTAAYYLTVGLFVFIGIKQMNIGGPIVDYAFGALAIGAAVAFALAFGLGGRDAAARLLADVQKPTPAAPVKTAAVKTAPLKTASVKKAPATKSAATK